MYVHLLYMIYIISQSSGFACTDFLPSRNGLWCRVWVGHYYFPFSRHLPLPIIKFCNRPFCLRQVRFMFACSNNDPIAEDLTVNT